MKVYVTRNIPASGINLLKTTGHEVVVNPDDRMHTKDELIAILKKEKPDAVLSLLTDKIDGEVMDSAPTVKIFANYAVGFDNFDREAAKRRNILLSNTPSEVLSDSVAEHTFALILALAHRIVESDRGHENLTTSPAPGAIRAGRRFSSLALCSKAKPWASSAWAASAPTSSSTRWALA